MARNDRTNELKFDVEHYDTLDGIVGTWRALYLELATITADDAHRLEEVSSLYSAMNALTQNLSEALDP